MSDLKPCPFCGCAAECHDLENHNSSGFIFVVTCGTAWCYGNTYSLEYDFLSKAAAIEAWNTRAPTEETARADAKCLWAQDIDGYWETSCGEAHIFEEGTPSQNSHDFCPYCGKHLEEQTP